MENNNLSKLKRNWLKINIKDIINNYDNNYNNIKEQYIGIINENINNDKIIKYIIKIISFNAKISNNIKIQNNCYDLFLLLINNLSKEDIIKYLTNLLIFLQENINIYSIEIGFELILQKIEIFEIKIFEILNGFCLHNMKQKEIRTQKEALLCYEKLILNYENIIKNKKEILKSFIENIIFNINIESLINRYQLLNCLNKLVCITKDKYESYIELTIYYIKDNLFINDNNIQLITLDIINNIIKYNKNHLKDIKNELNKLLNKLTQDKSIDNIIKTKIDDISNILNNNININNKNKKVKIKSEYLKRNVLKTNIENNKHFCPNKSELNVKSKDNLLLKDIILNKETKSEQNNKKVRKAIKLNKNNNNNIKVEIFVKKNPNLNKTLNKRIFTPLNTYKRKVNRQLSTINDDYNKNKKKDFTTTYINEINEDGYLNPIQMWYNLDNLKNSKKNMQKSHLQDNNNEIRIDKSIHNSQINIINPKKEEPKLELILNEIYKISKIQNDLAEKIISIEKNTFKQISYFNSRIDELEKKISNDDIINNNYKINPSYNINERLISFLNIEENDESIYYILGITEEQLIQIDNNLIEDVINKLIDFLDKGIFFHESINFIKKVFVKNKRRFKLDTIKKLLSSFDKVLKNKNISSEDSIDISLIISSIDIDKI